MRLLRAFNIADKEVVAFVGGGGKTTTMFRLAEELVAHGKHVVTTTTTRIFASQIQLAPQTLRVENGQLPIQKIRTALSENPHLLVIGATNDKAKAFGVDPMLVDQLADCDNVDVVLVEADGSRMRSFKAPAEHEPVIPASTTLLVPVVGIDVIGKRLTEEHVHRAELAAGIAEVPSGTVLQVNQVAQVMTDVRGALKNKPGAARVIPLLNKVETAEQYDVARRLANQILKQDAICAVAIGAVRNHPSPVLRLQSRVTAVILAAGGSTRMRETKQLLPWGNTTLVGNAVQTAGEAEVSEIVVVTGNRAQEVQAQVNAVPTRVPVRVAHNSEWQTGRASSVRTGIGGVNENSSGALFINADQPFLTANAINALLEAFFETGAPLIVPIYEGRTGSPVLFARELFPELTILQGEQGGRDLLEKYRDVSARVEIENVSSATDLDTPDEYRQAVQDKNRERL